MVATAEKIFSAQLKEIADLRSAAQVAREAGRASMDDVERSAEAEQDLERTVEKLRKGFALAPEVWTTEPRTPEKRQSQDEIRAGIRRIIEWMFPRGGIRLHPNGKIDFNGTIRPDPGGLGHGEPGSGSRYTSRIRGPTPARIGG